MGIYFTDDLTAHPTGNDIPSAGNVILYPLNGTWFKMTDNGIPVALELTQGQIAALASAVQPGDDITQLNNNAGFQTAAQLANAIQNHENAPDPHDQYTTDAEAQALVDQHANRTDNPHNVTAAQVGTLTTAQINNQIQTAINNLVNGAPGALDQLNEIAQAILDNDGDIAGLVNQIAAVANDLANHVGDFNNPHQVTKAQVGLGNADNTSDANKPVSLLQQQALDLKANQTALVALQNALNSLTSTFNLNAIKRDGSVVFQNNQSMGNNKITNLGAPTNNNDAATKIYIDNLIASIGAPVKSLFDSGRFRFPSDERWITNSDDTTAWKGSSFQESGGGGNNANSNPTTEWEHLGYVFNQGTILKSLTWIGRVNNSQITDIKIRPILVYPTLGWDSDYDNDAENTSVVVADLLWKDSSPWTSLLDLHRKEFSLGDFTVPENAMLKLYLKPVGNLSGTRDFYSTWRIDYV